MVSASLPSLASLAPLLVAFIAGMCVPFEFGMRRLRGFGMFVLAKLPQYEPDSSSDEPVAEEQS